MSRRNRLPLASCTPNRMGAHCKLRPNIESNNYSSFLETHGQPLIDLSLYVSSENYHASTRPAYSHILHWPNTWLRPPQRRAAAKARTDHLNFSALDLDTVNQDEKQEPQFAAGAEIPRRLIRSAPRTTSLAKKSQHAARFRLDRLAERFFEPLNRMLQGKNYLLSDERLTSLDCLALGYLALVLVPKVPQAWLAQKVKTNYPDLCRYVEDLARDCFGLELHTSSEEDPNRDGRQDTVIATTSILPWKTPEVPTSLIPLNININILPLLESLPLFGSFYRPPPLQSPTTNPHDEFANRIPILPTFFLGLTASIAALGTYILWTGEMPSSTWLHAVRQRHRMTFGWPLGARGGRTQRLHEMGEAGAMLGAVDFGRV
ncbi:MAG: hypothetical protein Q9213_005688 [Squamulea squamosa]